MKTSTKVILAGLVVTITAGSALAASGWHRPDRGDFQRHGRAMFDKIDADKDGAVSLDEMMKALTARFDKADADGNSVVTKAEIVNAVATEKDFPRASRFSGRIADRIVYRLDLDNNGDISRAEMENRARKVFALFDRNDDGKVELAELRHTASGFGRGMGRDGGPGMGRHHRGMHFGWGPDGGNMPADDGGASGGSQ